MAQYLSPGVYVEEKSSGVKPIEGVGTSTGAFVGIAEKGPVGEAVQIANWTQFVNKFGGYISNGNLAFAVNQFFSEGGTRCFVVRTCHYENITKNNSMTSRPAVGTLMDGEVTAEPSLGLIANSDGEWGGDISVEVKEASDPAKEFKLVVNYGDEKEVEIFDNLTMENVVDEVASDYITVEKDSWVDGDQKTSSGKIPKIGNKDTPVSVTLSKGSDGILPTAAVTLMDNEAAPRSSMRVTAAYGGEWGNDLSVGVAAGTTGFKLIVEKGDDTLIDFDDLTLDNAEFAINGNNDFIKVETDKWYEDGVEITGSGEIPAIGETSHLTGGNNDEDSLIPSDFIGDESAQNGLRAFDVVDDINIVAIPDAAQSLGDSHLNDVILLAYGYCENRKDCFFIADPPENLDPTGVAEFREGLSSSFASLYYPWVLISHPITGETFSLPPSGTVAGTYAHTDSVRGVHKSPAGITEGKLGVSGIERIITKSEHDGLNHLGINVIRSFPASGICIWGTRTLSSDAEWKYLNIRRLFLFLEETIDKASQWVVFEPNSPALWGSVKRNLTAFLLRVWKDGALFGSTPEEAFFVKVDDENNPEEVRNAGQLIIEVGVAPVRPAEFVIIRIRQKTLSK